MVKKEYVYELHSSTCAYRLTKKQVEGNYLSDEIYLRLTKEQKAMIDNQAFDNVDQKVTICIGFEELTNEQVAIYAKPEFNYKQMTSILKGFRQGLTIEQVRTYAKPEFSWQQMQEKRLELGGSL